MSGFYGDDVLAGVSSRLYGEYSRASEQGSKVQLEGTEYGDVRNSTESLDELVHRNIQDVLATVHDDEEEHPYGDSTKSTRAAPLPTQGISTRQLSQKPTPPINRTASSTASKPIPAITAALPPQRRLSTVGSMSRGSSGTNIATSTAPKNTLSSSSAARSASPSHAPSTASPSRGTQPPQHDPHHSSLPNPGLASSIIVQGPFPGGSSVSLDVPGNLEASLRLHKARIQGLEEDLMSMTRTAQDKDKLLVEALKESKSTRAEKAAWSKEQKGLQTQVERLKRATGDAETALAARDVAVKELSVEGSKGEKARQAVEAEVKSRDVRLQRALEEVERYKSLLSDVRGQEREVKDVARSEYTRVVTENKRLERQRAELIVAFRKQLKLIDVLKRQRLHLEAGRALQFTEDEFLKMIDVS